ncbi:MAG: hypothetical protein E6K51_05990 [Gammaproteobacteria bacterium]|nr:MAG: hypothetical protein E6K51_05990 [Gammaproteobacteria bacterium]
MGSPSMLSAPHCRMMNSGENFSRCATTCGHTCANTSSSAPGGSGRLSLVPSAAPRPPMVASGLRIGTPASTTRGFKVREVEQVADFIAEVLDAEAAPAAIERVRPKVLELCGRFPVYGP